MFPGGCLPSLAAILESVGRTTDLRLVGARDFTHYAETLRCWRQAFNERVDKVHRARLFDRVDPPLELLPVLLRGRFPGAADRLDADSIQEAELPGRPLGRRAMIAATATEFLPC